MALSDRADEQMKTLVISDAGECAYKTLSIPLLTRTYLDPSCKHEWWLHTCACSSKLGEAVEERYDWPRKVVSHFTLDSNGEQKSEVINLDLDRKFKP